MKKITKIVTHDGSFHTDDIFAVATLSVLLEDRKEAFEIIRTRDEDIIKTGDYIVDVGGIYDEELNKFDHHQTGGAGKRENGLLYSSFGLVWKKFGIKIAGGTETAKIIENKLVVPVDANDNGIDLVKNNIPDVFEYTLQDVFAIFSPTALEDEEKDKQFIKALVWAKEILKREIKRATDQIEITKIIKDFYKKAGDKRLIVIDKPRVSRFNIWDALQDFPEPLFAVYGDKEDWSVVSIRKEKNSFSNRKGFPSAWAGLRKEELRKITGVEEAVFCHNKLFLAVAKSKEGAIKLAELALDYKLTPNA